MTTCRHCPQPAPEVSCCELACYEDPGCACEGCAQPAPDAPDVRGAWPDNQHRLAAIITDILPTIPANAGPVSIAALIAHGLDFAGVDAQPAPDALRVAAQRVVHAYMGPAEYELLKEADILALRAALEAKP